MLTKDPVPGISAAPFEDNLRYFNVVLEGPPETPYAGAQRGESQEKVFESLQSATTGHCLLDGAPPTLCRWHLQAGALPAR